MSIPELWQQAPLEELIIDMQPGFAQRPGSQDGRTPQLRTNNVSTEGRIDLTEVKHVKTTAGDIEKYGVKRGDVIFNNTNSPDLVGKTAYFDLPGVYVLSNHMTRIRVNGDLLDAEFLARYLHYMWEAGTYRRWAAQWVNQAAINQMSLGQFQILLPPLSEQHRVAAILREADDLRYLRHQANKRAKELLPSLFNEVFGILEQYPSSTLSEVCDFITKGTTPKTSDIKEIPNEGDVPFLKVYHISDEGNIDFEDNPSFVSRKLHTGLLKRSQVFPGDVLMNIVGPPLGKIGLVPSSYPEWNVNQALAIFRCTDVLEPLYLFCALRSDQILPNILKLARGIRQQNLNLEQCRNIRMPVPPISLQREFAHQALQAREIRSNQTNAGTQHDNLFRSLLTYAFSGELTLEWREARQAELAQESDEMHRRLEAARRSKQLKIVESSDPQALAKALSRFSTVMETIVQPTVQLELWAKESLASSQALYAYMRLAESIRPYATSMASTLNTALADQISRLNAGLLENLGSILPRLIDAWREASQAFNAELAEKIAQLIEQQLGEPLDRADVRATVLRVIDAQPRYWTLSQLADDWRLNHLPRNTIREVIDMLVVLGEFRQALIRPDAEQVSIGPIEAYTRVTIDEMIGDVETIQL
jgi:type I restriction enzyme, S subunit